ncbi:MULTISPECIES: hypothetical protein [Streptomyces]|uniref:Uncharacterized protein n=1 Tax=Streptomyces sanyensis TaxID=568869 RepID=A0ABP9B9X3_9ACTN
MPVPTHTRPRPPAAAGTRLPWWALVLPALAFAALLALITATGAVQAGDGAQGAGAVGALLAQVRETLAP